MEVDEVEDDIQQVLASVTPIDLHYRISPMGQHLLLQFQRPPRQILPTALLIRLEPHRRRIQKHPDHPLPVLFLQPRVRDQSGHHLSASHERPQRVQVRRKEDALDRRSRTLRKRRHSFTYLLRQYDLDRFTRVLLTSHLFRRFTLPFDTPQRRPLHLTNHSLPVLPMLSTSQRAPLLGDELTVIAQQRPGGRLQPSLQPSQIILEDLRHQRRHAPPVHYRVMHAQRELELLRPQPVHEKLGQRPSRKVELPPRLFLHETLQPALLIRLVHLLPIRRLHPRPHLSMHALQGLLVLTQVQRRPQGRVSSDHTFQHLSQRGLVQLLLHSLADDVVIGRTGLLPQAVEDHPCLQPAQWICVFYTFRYSLSILTADQFKGFHRPNRFLPSDATLPHQFGDRRVFKKRLNV